MSGEMVKKEEKIPCDAVTVRPAADVIEEADGMEISFEVPGAGAQNISLEVHERLLSLSACSTLHRHGMPIVYKRAFYLSEAVDCDRIKARIADGVLTLTLPKAESAKTHQIPVKS